MTTTDIDRLADTLAKDVGNQDLRRVLADAYEEAGDDTFASVQRVLADAGPRTRTVEADKSRLIAHVYSRYYHPQDGPVLIDFLTEFDEDLIVWYAQILVGKAPIEDECYILAGDDVMQFLLADVRSLAGL